MTFTFYPDIIPNVEEAELISGDMSNNFANSEYLIVKNEDQIKAFKIIYEYHCSPFKQTSIQENLLLVGHEAHFYLYDIRIKKNLLALKMNGYFGHFYMEDNYFYVADANGLFCIEKKGEIVWHNNNLGIDGVVVNKFTETQICGSGEWDPPGGWSDFNLDKKTGKSITTNFG
jgi:hypothetical protein